MALTQIITCRTEFLWHVDTAENKEARDWALAWVSWCSSSSQGVVIPWVWSGALQLAPPEEVCSWDPALSSTQRNQALAQGLVWRLSWHRQSPNTIYPCTPFSRCAEPHGKGKRQHFAGMYTHRLVTVCKVKVQWDCSSAGKLQMYNGSYCLPAYNSHFMYRNQTSPHSKDIFLARLLGFLKHELLNLKQPSKYTFPLWWWDFMYRFWTPCFFPPHPPLKDQEKPLYTASLLGVPSKARLQAKEEHLFLAFKWVFKR